MKKSYIRRKVFSLEKKRDTRRMLEKACELFESGDRLKSIKLFIEAAKNGSLEAQINIANIYDDGDGVEEDFSKARYWYKCAISSGSPVAAYNLGVSYKNRGIFRWAKYWLQMAKRMGDEDAEYVLKLIE